MYETIHKCICQRCKKRNEQGLKSLHDKKLVLTDGDFFESPIFSPAGPCYTGLLPLIVPLVKLEPTKGEETLGQVALPV